MVEDSTDLWSATPIEAASAAAGDPTACQQACLDNSDCFRVNMGPSWCYLYSDTPSTEAGWFGTGHDSSQSWEKQCGT